MQGEDVGAGVVTGRVEVELGTVDVVSVDLGDDDTLGASQRSGEPSPIGR